ncbi:hypothetical protein [Microbulbifer aggregans]|uniref:hypothetical protein n=1 Tax=Microbulbifer aggregans TaxID=1769779 RepID=UPI001CFD3106|nr:hypothetical protein [Microbulbifer aggregans]
MLRLRAKWLALFGRSGEPVWPDGYRTYPNGYAIDDLVPQQLSQVERQKVGREEEKIAE